MVDYTQAGAYSIYSGQLQMSAPRPGAGPRNISRPSLSFGTLSIHGCFLALASLMMGLEKHVLVAGTQLRCQTHTHTLQADAKTALSLLVASVLGWMMTRAV